VATLKGHSDGVSSISFSPDSNLLAGGDGDNTIKLWDVKSRKEVAMLVGHSDWVSSVSFSPDGGLLASGSGDETIKLWDVKSLMEVATLKGHLSSVYSVVFSPDGNLLASGSGDETINLWDVKSRKEVATLKGHSGCVFSVSFSPDGSLLASGNEGRTILLWDMKPYIAGNITVVEPIGKHSVPWGGVKEYEDIDAKEYSFALEQNYPNPFNPETWVPYQLKEDADVEINIYNESGQLVRAINLGHKPAGMYTDRTHQHIGMAEMKQVNRYQAVCISTP